MNKADLKLDWCSYKAAKYAVMKWHYSNSISVGKLVKIGVWEKSEFKGAVIFSCVVGAQGYKTFDLKNEEICELTRVAMRAHCAPVTKILSIAIKMLKKTNPGLKLIISYADPYWGHLGKIYQAGNWLYLGESTKSLFYKIGESLVHSRTANPNNKQFGKLAKNYNLSAAERIIMPSKHKYAYPLDKEIKKKIIKLSKPCPQKISVGSNLADAPDIQSGKGGSIPTPTLQPTVEHG